MITNFTIPTKAIVAGGTATPNTDSMHIFIQDLIHIQLEKPGTTYDLTTTNMYLLVAGELIDSEGSPVDVLGLGGLDVLPVRSLCLVFVDSKTLLVLVLALT